MGRLMVLASIIEFFFERERFFERILFEITVSSGRKLDALEI